MGEADLYRLAALERAIDENTKSIRSITETLLRLIVLEERYMETRGAIDRAFKTIDTVNDKSSKAIQIVADKTENQEERLRVIENDMPQLLETRKWVVGGIITGVGMMLVALLKLVFIK